MDAWCHVQVCSGSENVTIERHNDQLMRKMMQTFFEISQAFNKSGRSKLLVPVDVALERHFSDDKVMKVWDSRLLWMCPV